MIRVHEFNSEWWGCPVGIVDDPVFFSLAPDERKKLIDPYSWVEYRAVVGEHPPFRTVSEAGFFHADTQVEYEILLEDVRTTPSMNVLKTRFADEQTFVARAEDMKDFAAERFNHLPGMTPQRVNSRYALWGRKLVAESPEWCMEVLESGEVQGWSFGRMTNKGLNLTLRVLRRGARIRGRDLYRKTNLEYAKRGATTGWASHSVSNLAGLNINASLGAHYKGVEHFWLWTRGGDVE